jgi:thiamine-monophosphate kinase
LLEEMVAAAALLETNPTQWALYGGEDYELLFTLPAGQVSSVREVLSERAVAVTVIGEIVAEGIWYEEETGELSALVPLGFQHFGSRTGTARF